MIARTILATIAAALIAIAFFALRPAGEPGVAFRDFEAYYSAGATWLAHGDAYSMQILQAERSVPGVDRTREELLPFVGLPATLPFWSLFAHTDYANATRWWRALLVLAFAALVIATIFLVDRRSRAIELTSAALFALAFVPITSDFVLGQAALPAYAAIALTMLTLEASLPLAALLGALGALQPNLALPLIVEAATARGCAMLALAAAGVYATGAFVDGSGWIARYLLTLAEHSRAEGFSAIQFTPAAIAYGFGMSTDAARVFGWIVASIALVIAIIMIVRARDRLTRFAIACCALPFVCGFFHEHDFVVLFVPALLCARYAPPKLQPVALVGAGFVAVNWLDFAQQPQAVVQDCALAFGEIAAYCAYVPAPSPRLIAPTLLALGAIAIGAWTGASHHLPIWPNDMAPLASIAGSTPAAVWKMEQLRTGLLRPDSAAAFLRCFSLVGCALLFFVSSRLRYQRP